MTGEKATASPLFRGQRIFCDDPAAIGNTEAYFNKPAYTGIRILKLSKLLIALKIKPRYGVKAEVFVHLYRQSDRKSGDEKHLQGHTVEEYRCLFDTIEYPEGHPLRSMKNKKVFGRMKDEMQGQAIAEIVVACSKVYSIL